MINLVIVKLKSDLYGIKSPNIDQIVYCRKDNTFYHLKDISRKNKVDGWESIGSGQTPTRLITANGSIGISGSPDTNHITIWSDPTTITGSSNLTYDGTTLRITGEIIATGNIIAHG